MAVFFWAAIFCFSKQGMILFMASLFIAIQLFWKHLDLKTQYLIMSAYLFYTVEYRNL